MSTEPAPRGDDAGTRSAGPTEVPTVPPPGTDAGPTAPDATPLPWCGRFDVLEEVGRGGMGVVYKVFDPVLRQVRALKRMTDAAAARPALRARFIREARAMAALDHRHVVPIREVSEDELYFVMPYAGGGSLDRHRERFLGDGPACAALVAKVARAVHHAHENKILHRDLKPLNILLDDAGEPLVADFGLAKPLDEETVTQAGVVMGTPAYMAPEQRSAARRLGPACDIWALGVTLQELVTGARPTDGEPTAAHLDAGLRAIVDRCLQEEPADRYPTAAALADDLEAWLRGTFRPRRRLSRGRRAFLLAGTGGLLALAAGAGAWAWRRRRPPNEDPERIRWELATEGKAELLRRDGMPRWVNEELKPLPRYEGSVDGGETVLTVTSPETRLLELLHGPATEDFRFKAMVRQDKILDPGRPSAVGLYVGRSPEGPSGRVYQCFICLSFDDASLRQAAQAPASLEINFVGPDWHRGFLGTAPVPLPPDRWYDLEIGRSRSLVDAALSGPPMPARETGYIQGILRTMTTAKPPPVNGFNPPLNTTGGVGLLAINCRASFRNVRLERQK